ncbi:MAG: D-sedoheptulose-7-phosphate isomerase [Anaerolineales bacterium]
MDIIEQYLTELEQVIHNLSRNEVRAAAAALLEAWRARKQVFLLGNGGSAATASHMMNDLNKFTRVAGKRRFRAIALTDNVPWLTAVGNDQSYDDIFVEPLMGLMEPGDTILAISASGNSPNVVKAAEYAKAHGATLIGFCGAPGGKLAQLADVKVIIPSDRIGHQEDGHMILDHVLSLALREMIRQEPD